MKKNSINEKLLSSSQREKLLSILKTRFEKNMNRHKDLKWDKVLANLEKNNEKLWSFKRNGKIRRRT